MFLIKNVILLNAVNVEIIVLLSPFLLIGILLIGILLYQISVKGVNAVNFSVLLSLGIIFIYAFIPVYFFLNPAPFQEFYDLRGTKLNLHNENLPWLRYFFVIFLSLTAIFFANLIPVKYNNAKQKLLDIKEVNWRFHLQLLNSLLFITVILIIILFFSYGGPLSYISQSLTARHLGVEADVTSFAFLKRLVHPLSLITMLFSFSFYAYIEMINSSMHKFKLRSKLAIIVSTTLFVFLAISSGGREFLLFGVIQAIFCFRFFKKIKTPYVVASFLLIGIILIYGKPLFGAVATYFSEDFEEAVNTFNILSTNPYITPQGGAAIFRFFINYSQHLVFIITDFENYRLLWMDIYNVVYSVWPRAIFDPGLRLQMPIEITSLHITDGLNEKAGSLPGLLVFFGMIAGWWLIPVFVFIFTFSVRSFLAYLQNKNTPFLSALYTLILFYCVSFIWDGEPVHFANFIFPVFIVFIIYFVLKTISQLKMTEKVSETC